MKIALTYTPATGGFGPILMRGDLATAFALAEELGYDGVELHLRQPGDVDEEVVRRLMASHRQGVPTLGTGMAAGQEGLTFSDLNPAIRRRAVERIKEHIRLGSTLGSAVTIGLIRGILGSDPAQRAARESAATVCLEECCEAAESAGVTLVLEPLNRYESNYLNTLEEAAAVITRIGSPNLKLLADTFHMNIEEVDLPASLRRAGQHLAHVHLVDSNRQAPGHGHLDLRSVLQALGEVGYRGYLSFEVLPLPDPRRAAEDGIRTVRDILAVA